MNKFFVLALFALVAACSAAPSSSQPALAAGVEPAAATALEPTLLAEGLEAHEQDKRAILLATTGGYRYLPEYGYRYGYPSYYRYGYPSVAPLTYSAYPYRYLI